MLKSNIQGVMRRLQMHAEGIEGAIASAFVPERWIEPLKRVAEKTMQVMATAEEAKFIPLFLNTVEAVLLVSPTGMRVSMEHPGDSAGVVGRAIDAKERQQTHVVQGVKREKRMRFPLDPKDQRDVDRVRAAVFAWVVEEKDKDMRDAGETDEQIAAGLLEIMFTSKPTEKQLEARQGLASVIQDYMLRQDKAAAGLSVETINLWMRAVLVAWRETIRTQLVEGMPDALAKMRKRYLEKLV